MRSLTSSPGSGLQNPQIAAPDYERIAGAGPDTVGPVLELLEEAPRDLEAEIMVITPARLTPLLPARALELLEAVIDLQGGEGLSRRPPTGLVRVPGRWFPRRGAPPGRQPDLWLSRDAHGAWSKMQAVIEAELGSAPVLASAYRSPAYQAMLFVGELAAREWRLEEALRRVLPPARSEHCVPRAHAVDLCTREDAGEGAASSFADTGYYRWLRTNAREHGFAESYPEGAVNPGPEPWHWRFVGR